MKDLETRAAGNYAYAAVMDAQRQNANNKSHYSQDKIRQAVTVRDLIDSYFNYSKLYINYRKKFIAVKAEGARRKAHMGLELMDLFNANGYSVVATPQGLIVRIDK
jgi:hypothetical protein